MIEQIKEALEKAEVGPWATVTLLGGTIEVWQSIDNGGIARIFNSETAKANVHLIANAPEWLRYLLGEVERLEHLVKVNAITLDLSAKNQVALFKEYEELRNALEECEAEMDQWRDPAHAMACVKAIINKALERSQP